MNENVGEMKWGCHEKDCVVFVRKDRGKKMYLACPECGIFAPRSASFQKRIKREAVMYSSPSADYKGGGEMPENPEKNEENNENEGKSKAKNKEPKQEKEQELTADDIYNKEMS